MNGIKFASMGLVPAAVMLSAGCFGRSVRTTPTPPAPLPVTVAVAPALNQSGSQDFEPLRTADLMASELTQLPGVRVIGVNRVLAVLSQEGLDRITSPRQAIRVARQVGADLILMFAITEYDPHEPPIVGMAAQLYAVPAPSSAQSWDPTLASRAVRPPMVRFGADESVRPRAETQHVFNASRHSVAKDVLQFADERDAGRSPFGPRLYLVSQEHFLRYCCHVTGRELLERFHRATLAAEPSTESRG